MVFKSRAKKDPAIGKCPWITKDGFRTEKEAWKAHSQAHFPSNVALLVAQIENHASSSRYEPTSTDGGRRS